MVAHLDLIRFNTQSIIFIVNYKLLLENLKFAEIGLFINIYLLNYIDEFNLYLRDIFLEIHLIDESIYKKFKDQNLSILDHALKTNLEIANELQISLETAHVIKILSEFHYSNTFGKYAIYYAHPLDYYLTESEKNDITTIKENFPFALVINPADFE